ncbi:MAG: hypothetical protein K0S22_2524 [Oscillospiraceae bacterium]|nr:hypothetical protein [Oscillospiraceae bacterium]
MILKKLTPDAYIISDWSGGKTRQIAIDPPLAVYADRDFNFRLSSATVEQEESDFTPLPDYERIISPVKGQLQLLFNDSAQQVILNEFELRHFDGAWKTSSRGKVTDYNLMTRKGICTGKATAITLAAGEKTTLPTGFSAAGKRVITLVWCVEGGVKISVTGESIDLKSQDSAWIEKEASAVNELEIAHVEGMPAKLMLAEVKFI